MKSRHLSDVESVAVHVFKTRQRSFYMSIRHLNVITVYVLHTILTGGKKAYRCGLQSGGVAIVVR